MAWIESHQSLGTHLKLRRLARELRIHRAQAIGHLHFLWWWALDNAPTGNLSALAPAEIAEVAEWPGSGDAFVAAMKACRWLDEDGMIHDWMEYAGCLIQQRNKDKERKRNARSKKPPEDDPPPSSGNLNPVQRTSIGHPSDGVRTADVPNPTQPNPTEGTHTHHAQAPGDWRDWPGLKEVKAYAGMHGIPPAVAEAFWSHFEAQGWQTKDGLPIVRWQPKLTSWWVNEQARTAKDAARPPRPASNGRRTPLPATPDNAGF